MFTLKYNFKNSKKLIIEIVIEIGGLILVPFQLYQINLINNLK